MDIDSFSDTDLIADRMVPVTALMHQPQASGEVPPIQRLTRGQGALLGYWLVESRSEGGLADFCRLSAHRLDDPDFWTLLAIGRRITGDGPLEALLEELRIEWTATAGHPRAEVLGRLDARHRRLRGPSRRRMARHIRGNPGDFPAWAR